MRPSDRTVEHELARLGTRAHGIVTRQELLQTGVSASGIKRRIQKGQLLREYPGVYRVGHRAPSVEASYLAAVRACGDGALLSGRAAGHLLAIIRALQPPEVTAPTERRIPGIRTHRSARICADHASSWRRVPVTTVACTLVDLAATLTPDELARAAHEAGGRFETTPAQVEAVLARRPNARGAR